MRRPLLVLVLLATVALGWARAAFAFVHGPRELADRSLAGARRVLK